MKGSREKGEVEVMETCMHVLYVCTSVCNGSCVLSEIAISIFREFLFFSSHFCSWTVSENGRRGCAEGENAQDMTNSCRMETPPVFQYQYLHRSFLSVADLGINHKTVEKWHLQIYLRLAQLRYVSGAPITISLPSSRHCYASLEKEGGEL
jgi:hypothetical protein